MKLRAISLLEMMITILIVGILAVVIMSSLKNTNIQEDALKKAGGTTRVQVEIATATILARDTNNYILTRMKDSSGEFSIAASGSLARTVALYKKRLIGLRNSSVSATYTAAALTDGSTSYSSLKPSSFTAYKIKNGAYFGVKLHGNCTTSMNYVYDPATPETRTKSNTCAALFFDVNADKDPNRLGIDQYIVALGKRGIK